MLFVFLFAVSLAAPSICSICKTTVKKGLDLSRKGEPLNKVNMTLLSECRQQSNFLIKAGCNAYVKKYVSKLYNGANKTKLTPFQICKKNKACESELQEDL